MAIDKLGGPGGYDRPERLGGSRPTVDEPTRSNAGSAEDRIDLSPAARRAAQLSQRANELPEIRQERVDALRQQIENDEYRVDPRRLAREILEFEDAFAG